MKKLNIEYKKKLLETVAFSYGQISLYELVQKEHRHFHPSGNVCPSKEDTSITDRMLKVGDILGIPLVDHVIVGKRNQPYFSFREHKLMDFNHVALETDYMQLQFSTTLVAEEKMEPVQESENEKVAEEAITEEQEPVRRRRGR